MLGHRTAPRQDLLASTAELVHSAPLTVPADLVSTGQQPDAAQHLERLRSRVRGMVLTV